jgi:hypothetical protein
MQTVYVPVKYEERKPAVSDRYGVIHTGDDCVDSALYNGRGFIDAPRTVQYWLEVTEAVLLNKEDAEKIKDTEKRLTERLAWCDRKIALLMSALHENNIPEPMLKD